jgi:hypothetical protein
MANSAVDSLLSFWPEGSRGNLRRALTCTAGVVLAVVISTAIAAALMGESTILQREGGVLETLSLVCWVLAFAISLWSALKAARFDDRLAGGALGGLALLAALRELDAHILLNPATIGEYGVRYKISWWLDTGVPLWLKLGWATLFLGVLFLLVFPGLRLRQSAMRLLRNADPPLVLLLACFVFLAIGFGIDDLLRGSRRISFNTRQVIEETSELIGALLFLLSASLQSRTPWCSRLPASRAL